MTYRRLLILYITFIAAFFVLVSRVFLISSNRQYSSYAKGQTVTTLPLAKQRGNFYDCNGQALTGCNDCWYALCIPGEESYADLYDFVSVKEQTVLYQKRNSAIPFLIEVKQDLQVQNIYTFPTVERYATIPIATHLIGYINKENEGVAGLEAALDETLSGTGEQSYLQCVTNAEGELLDETRPILYQADAMCADVQLTLQKELQRLAEGVADEMMEKGAVIILDVETAKVRASVSVPSYHPNAVEDSLDSEDGALLNRAFCSYSVGSVFKPVLAAAAIEQGCDELVIDCVGYTEINGQIYRCANGVPHGKVDLNAALEQSCNCYFVALGQMLGGEVVSDYASAFGLGETNYITDTLKTAVGNVPDGKTLQDLGQLANVSFGQGELLATPLQIAGVINTIVNGGTYMTPSYVEGTCVVDEQGVLQLTKVLCHPKSDTVITEQTAKRLQEMLVNVVCNGTGSAAQPKKGVAGGKTGTAQTGRYDENGEEYKNLWFGGFYPAENPRYTIVVMQDDQTDIVHSSAEIFANVCNGIALLDDSELGLAESCYFG